MNISNLSIEHLVRESLLEDIGQGDVTTDYLIPSHLKAKAKIIFKEKGILAGLDVTFITFKLLDSNIICQRLRDEGESIDVGEIVATISGPACSIITAERTALNFLQRLSGIATMTRRAVEIVKGTKVKILDTRKTTPGLRSLEKYAVRVGGAQNHRLALDSGILIKDNHIKMLGSIKKALEVAKKHAIPTLKIEIEVSNMEELKEATNAGADIIMLDNFSVAELKEAVKLTKGKVLLEASGGVTLENLLEISRSGVNFISMGALTHSAPALDISLELQPSERNIK